MLPIKWFSESLMNSAFQIRVLRCIEKNVWKPMISPRKRFLAAATDVCHTTMDFQVLSNDMVRLFLKDWAPLWEE